MIVAMSSPDPWDFEQQSWELLQPVPDGKLESRIRKEMPFGTWKLFTV